MSAPDDTWTLRRVLSWTTDFFQSKGLDSPRLDAELLIAHAQGVDRIRLYMDLDKPLLPDELTAIRARVQRRARFEPVAYILGHRGFWSLDLQVDPRVLVPRPDTERLVELALARLKGVEAPVVVDVGTGSGCVALAIGKDRPDATIHAIDRSTDALDVASANAAANDVSNVTFHVGDLLAPMAALGRVDMVVSNPPYIPSADIERLMPDVRQYEPRGALDGGPDGLDLVRRLIVDAAPLLGPGGALLMEIGFDQGTAVADLCRAHFSEVTVHPDYAGHDRVVEALK